MLPRAENGKRTLKANEVQIFMMISAQFGIPILLIQVSFDQLGLGMAQRQRRHPIPGELSASISAKTMVVALLLM